MPAERAGGACGAGGVLAAAAAAAVAFLGGLGNPPYLGRDEGLYREAGREMLASGDWITPRVNGAFFFEKPPLLYWLDAISYSTLGQTPFAARVPAALLGLLTVVLAASLAGRVWGRRAGMLAGAMLVTCPLIALIARMGIMDMPLTCLVTLSMLAYARWRLRGGLAPALVFGVLTGLALLLKGLAGGLAPAIALVHGAVFRRASAETSPRQAGRAQTAVTIVIALIAAAAVAAPWFLAMAAKHGEGYTAVFFIHEHLLRMAKPMQGHGGPVVYYLALIAFAFFPWVAFLPGALRRPEGQTDEQTFWRGLAIVWLLVVLIPYSLIKTKLPGYIVPLFPPMAMLVAAELERRRATPGRGPWIAVTAGGIVLAGLFAMLPAFAGRVGARYGVPNAASMLIAPAAVWVAGYLLSAIGGIAGLREHAGMALALMIAGQVFVIGSLLVGMLPVLSPYLGGGPAELAMIAERDLPGRQVVLYATRPEAVAFALRRSVPAFSRNEKTELLAKLRERPTALIAPRKEAPFWQSLPAANEWRSGLDVLLYVPRMEKTSRFDGEQDSLR